jgi:hypothetical protein
LPFTSTLVLYLQARSEPTRVELLTGLYSNDRLLVLPESTRLGRKLMVLSNTLAYYDKTTMMTAKSFTLQAHGCTFRELLYAHVYKCLEIFSLDFQRKF